MRRILPIAIATAVFVAAFAGIASARLAHDEAPRPAAAPMRTPAAIPAADREHPGTYGFRTSAAIARQYETGTPAQAGSGGGASATVTVTATVLPVVFLVYGDDGDLERIVTNSPDRDARGVLFVPRVGSETGDPVELDRAAWAQARAALRHAHAGTGTIWSA